LTERSIRIMQKHNLLLLNSLIFNTATGTDR